MAPFLSSKAAACCAASDEEAYDPRSYHTYNEPCGDHGHHHRPHVDPRMAVLVCSNSTKYSSLTGSRSSMMI
ncbi:hypothetical protein EYF80_054493 [Liparis tanakae]|uniref:Uncharacterized protein n=1 Tax=Liparis tanakae TaxID=230148 RepID=A0A4Z2F2S7_9TELE|nr:hypothetical protein EYF80_054493 [Liparis tanakae]